MNIINSIWVEKYRPKTVDECIIPKSIKNNLEQIIIHKNVPNLMIHSTLGGSGKTTVVRALANQLDLETLFINASEQRGIDVLRTDITQFVTTMSLEGRKKCVIFDEFDNATSASQSALRNFIEQFSHVKYFFTCNFIDKVIQPLQSRCSLISFTWPKEDYKELKNKFFKRILYILEQENILYEKMVLVELVNRFFPDFRRILNEIQRYSSSGKIDEGLLTYSKTYDLFDLFQKIKEKKFTEMRQWIEETEISDYESFFKKFYKELKEFVHVSSLPDAIRILDEYEFRHAFILDKQINLIALCTEIMAVSKFI